MHLFVYGTLMFPEIWQTLVRSRYRAVPAHIRGFRRSRIAGDCYPVIRPAATSRALHGILYMDLRREDIATLDRFEGPYYQRWPLRIYAESGHPRQLRGDAYVLKPDYRHLASNRPWSAEAFRQRCCRRLHAALGRHFRRRSCS